MKNILFIYLFLSLYLSRTTNENNLVVGAVFVQLPAVTKSETQYTFSLIHFLQDCLVEDYRFQGLDVFV